MSDQKPSDLCEAAFDGDLEQVRALCEGGADVNSVGDNGNGTLLTFHPAVTAYLLANGADPNTQTNEFGAPILAGLCYVDQTECVRLLLEHGADPNRTRTESGETPLHHALANDASDETIALLIRHGANVNAQTTPGVYSYNFSGDTRTRGETPLHRAAAFAPLATVKHLLDAGADRSLADANGETPHQWAGWHRRPKELVDLVEPA